ncbi:MAG TPA: hypothetical protein VF100_07220, partial [Thermoanaerobaculia bacterium]
MLLGLLAAGVAGATGEPIAIPLAPGAWEALPADGVALGLAAAAGPGGEPALSLDFDFGGRGGWAAARHEVDLALPESYEIRFALRGEGTPNHLEIKLVEGDDVWWHVRRDVAWPAEWTPVRI